MLDDVRTAPVSDQVRAALGFLEVLTLRPAELGPEHLAPMRAAGVTDEGIAEAIHVCCQFNIIDRLADALDWEVPDKDQLRRVARVIFENGYRLPGGDATSPKQEAAPDTRPKTPTRTR